MLFECKLCRYTPGPKGAYMCFVQVARSKINISQPELKFADIAKVGAVQAESSLTHSLKPPGSNP